MERYAPLLPLARCHMRRQPPSSEGHCFGPQRLQLGGRYIASTWKSHLHQAYQSLQQQIPGCDSCGSYGSVYKGNINRIGTNVAIKVLNLLQQGATRSFMSECEALRNIRHRNLIKILTCCSSVDFKGNEFKALVLEYMPNGSLNKWLHKNGDDIGRNLKLMQRLNVAIDVASALAYLHCDSPTPIIHRDLKSSNVLLDVDMVSHVSDFGLARFMSASVAYSSSAGVKGSIGYVAPEYAMGMKASPQGDIYSYGILLLEMITGKEPTDNMFKDNTIHNFVKLALQDPDGVMQIADPHLLLEGSTNNNHLRTIWNVCCLSPQGDACNYGILLLEMITRKESTHDMFNSDHHHSQFC